MPPNFLPLYSGLHATEKYLKRLSQLQDALGKDNDRATTRELLHRLANNTGGAEVRRGIGAIAGWQRSRQLSEAPDLKMHGRISAAGNRSGNANEVLATTSRPFAVPARRAA